MADNVDKAAPKLWPVVVTLLFGCFCNNYWIALCTLSYTDL
jgi:hypothetical protein